ncbi:MAG: Methyltransferase type 11 [Methanomicrobiales archaeon 53_19]|nr:MAG: Methyltransferase type 11 [Methanomicrobiales archaeon 53_19]
MTDDIQTDEPPDSRTKGKHRDRRTIGPVPNLEEYVKPDWWRGIFNRLYLKTDGDVVDDQHITESEIDRIVQVLNLQSDAKILDLCCGQGRHTLELMRRGYNAEGLDQSHYLIQRARSTAKKEGLSVRFREGDARRLPYRTDTYDVVLVLGNSFGYFDSVEEDLRILTELRRILKPWGRVLLDVADGDYLKEHFQARSWEWIDDAMFVCRERSLSLDEQRLISREVITDVEKGVVADQFYAERLYTPEALRRLLEKAGFSGITFHKIDTESQRNQDLGMMERRHIVTAVLKKEWSTTKTRGQERAKHVAVMLGDPAKPDALKPSCTFDDDDFYTIDQMKVDYVFNLCDEGFNNDPRKELHVPALLEIFEIPYTGSGPQSLAFCYDKSLVRGVAKEMGIPVPDACFITPGDRTYDVGMKLPAIVKPNAGDSSYGITQESIARTIEELSDVINALRTKLGYDRSLLVEEFLTGKDISVGIIGNPSGYCTVLPIIEEDYSALPPELPRICGYEAKWLPDSPYWKIVSKPAELPEEIEKVIVRCCLALFKRLECRDYCRFDWRLDEHGSPKLLEVNPNPGWCWDGHLAKMAKYAGLSYPEMLGRILKAAEERFGMEPETGAREGEKDPLPFDLTRQTA